ncbi:helix-turn-helix domain-containing protein [Streptomyces canus]|uniref:helix-turn-helix domain-containing protein n=1 Tax=Streptomyces canus TaxID=58343 RepID=UPI0027870F83|nr:helix-turn-helix domain-containing protein [Streptomyces canus]MDQ0764689.1 DNA-binding response OmpR family regulator [Streptomyces canus]MDQ1066873.1 DNA-binding response OmpR family regulator [Streptomyces canus]
MEDDHLIGGCRRSNSSTAVRSRPGSAVDAYRPQGVPVQLTAKEFDLLSLLLGKG